MKMPDNAAISLGQRIWTRLPRHKGLLLALVLGILAPVLITSQYYQSILQLVLIYAILTEALDLILGRLGLASVAHGALFIIGAYALAILTVTYHWPYWYGFICAIGITLVVGMLLALVTMRLRDHFFAISTVAFASALAIIVAQTSLTGAGAGIIGVQPPAGFNVGGLSVNLGSATGQYYLSLLVLTIVVVILSRLDRSAFGRVLILIREDSVLAGALGTNVVKEKIKAFALSAAICGAAGCLFASYSTFVGPTDATLTSSFNVLIYDIVGGVGTLAGPIVGAAVVEGSTAYASSYAEWGVLVFGIFVLLILLFRPDGITGGIGRIGESVEGIVGWYRNRYGSPAVASGEQRDGPAPVGDASPEGPQPGQPSEAPVPAPAAPVVTSAAVRPAAADRDKARQAPILEAKDLVKRYGGIAAVDGVSVQLGYQEIVGVIGPNGAGKSTLFGMIAGTVRTTSGSILFKGGSLDRRSAYSRARCGIGRTFQTNRLLPGSTALDNLLTASGMNFSTGMFNCLVESGRTKRHTKAETERLYSLAALLNLDGALMTTPVGSLTVEQQRLVAIGMALAGRPQVLLLDEPFAGLRDEEASRLEHVITRIRDDGLSVLLVEHRMRIVMSLCDRVYVLDHGVEIAQGTPREVAKNEAVITAYLGRQTHA